MSDHQPSSGGADTLLAALSPTALMEHRAYTAGTAVRQRELVQASLLLSRREDRSTHPALGLRAPRIKP